jgi:hypothetical protein
MNKLVVLLILLLIQGCDMKSNEEMDVLSKERGELRNQLFKECMELAAKIERKGDDDVSDIVSKCDSVSYYHSNQILR